MCCQLHMKFHVYELQIETISTLMIFAVRKKGLDGFETNSGLNFSGLSFATAQVAYHNYQDHQ